MCAVGVRLWEPKTSACCHSGTTRGVMTWVTPHRAGTEFLDGTTATANQIDFIGLVVSYLTRHGAMEPAQLYDPPFTDNGPKGPDEFFPPTQMSRLVEIIKSINATADVQTA